MAGRGAQTFKKRQKEQQRKEKQQEKMAKRVERKRLGLLGPSDDLDADEVNPLDLEDASGLVGPVGFEPRSNGL